MNDQKKDVSMTNRFLFSWTEFSGSLGDLGLFIPLVVTMASIGKLDLAVILIAAGLMNIATGLIFRQPIPVQPMKAIAAVAITEGFTGGELMASGLLMGALLLAFALTGTIDIVNKIIPRPLVRGIQLGVGLKLAVKGIGWMMELPAFGWDSIPVAILTGVVLLIFLAGNKPGLIFIFFAGFILLYLENPAVYNGIGFSLPSFHIELPDVSEWKAGLLNGAIPQLPLTILNSVIAVSALSLGYFPDNGIKPKRMAVSVGVMNLLCVPFGAIPMCHGAGGLAAQYAFGARTGGSVIMLGAVKIAVGFAFGSVILGLLDAYPYAILGPMLVFAGIELAKSCIDVEDKVTFGIVLLTAACILKANTFIGFSVGAGLYFGYWIWVSFIQKDKNRL
ncbi:MAG: putative sulfate/molybdate transporter [Candidatus Anammoxibacter sp.]